MHSTLCIIPYTRCPQHDAMCCHTLCGSLSAMLSSDHLPGQRLPGAHGHDGTVALRYHPGGFGKLDDACGGLNVVDALCIVGYEGLQPVQSMVLLEQLQDRKSTRLNSSH